jgi:hypothetical protein
MVGNMGFTIPLLFLAIHYPPFTIPHFGGMGVGGWGMGVFGFRRGGFFSPAFRVFTFGFCRFSSPRTPYPVPCTLSLSPYPIPHTPFPPFFQERKSRANSIRNDKTFSMFAFIFI